MLQKEICCFKNTSTLSENLPSRVVKRNLLLEKDLEAYRELRKLCCKKKFAVGKRLRRSRRADQVVLEEEFRNWS